MHPHIPRPRRKATRTCTDTASVVRTVHGESMWPFTARVNEKTALIERIAAVAICRRLRDARRQIYAPPSNGQPPACGHTVNSKSWKCADVRFGSKADILDASRAMSALPLKADTLIRGAGRSALC